MTALQFSRLRQQYLHQGYAVLPKLSVPVLDSFVTAVTEGVRDRSSQLLYCPRQGDQQSSATKQQQDPFWQDLQKGMQRRREAQATNLRKTKRGTKDVASLDVFAMAQLIAEEMTKKDDVSSSNEAPPKEPPIQDDHTLMRAIDEARCNLWMTNQGAEELVRTQLATELGPAVREVAGLSNPVLFSDRPTYRIAYSRPIGTEFIAPHIALDPASIHHGNACCLWIVGDDTSSMRCPVRVLPNSPGYVQSRYPKIFPMAFNREYVPHEAQMSHYLQHFPGLIPPGGCGRRHAGAATEENFRGHLPRVESVPLQRGDVLLMQPHLMYTLGANYHIDPHLSWQLMLIDHSQGAVPSRVPHTWVKKWHRPLGAVEFQNERLFPKW